MMKGSIKTVPVVWGANKNRALLAERRKHFLMTKPRPEPGLCRFNSGRRESNPLLQLGKLG